MASARGKPVNPRYRTLLIWVLGFAAFPALRAAPPPIAQTEINYLLDFVEHSGCQFYRNGTWYDSKKARAHCSRPKPRTAKRAARGRDTPGR